MWLKHIIVFILLYFFALLQNSFFAHYKFFGIVPNLVFSLFFLIVFFSERSRQVFNWQIVFYALVAGLLMDIFTSSYLGVSVILLILIGFLLKITQALLKEDKSEFPFVSFLMLYIGWLLVFDVLNMFYLRFIDPSQAPLFIDWRFFAGKAYNLFFAAIIFWIYKRLLQLSNDDRQLTLFK